MKNSPWLISLGTLALGLLLGTIWSPRAKEPTPEQIAHAATQFQSSKSSPNNSSSFSNSSTSSTSSKGGSNSSLTPTKELSLETLVDLMSSINDEEDINPMEFTRYATQISNLNEFEALALLQELKGPFDDGQRDTQEFAGVVSIFVFSRLCELNGPEAMRLLRSGEIGKGMEDEMSVMGMNSWVAADPEGASAWFNNAVSKLDAAIANGEDLEEIEEPDAAFLVESEVFDSYLRGMSRIDPEGLKDSITSYQSQEMRDELLGEYADHMATNARTKEEILTLLNDPSLSSSTDAKVTLIEKLSEIDPRLAAEQAVSQPIGIARDDMIASAAASLVREDPSEGAAWYQAQELSPDTSETERLQLITNQWMSQDLEGAATWLLQQPNNNQRDASESSLATQSARTGEWEAAFRWSTDISDPQTRQRSLDQVLRRGWDRRSNTFNEEASRAAREAGFSEQVDAYLEAASQNSGLSGSRRTSR